MLTAIDRVIRLERDGITSGELDISSVKPPVIIADGKMHDALHIDRPLRAQGARVLGADDGSFEKICATLRTTSVCFFEMRVTDLTPLTQIEGLEHLSIHWNSKIQDITPLSTISTLRTLVLLDTPKIRDLSPIASLQRLEALAFCGGIWTTNRARSLSPLAALPLLEELRLLSIAVEEDGLRPLAGCTRLRRLWLPDRFPTEDYAYLSVHLPQVECQMLAPHFPTGLSSEHDVKVVGKRKPYLHSIRDAKKLARYEQQFRALQRGFASDR